MPKNTKSLRTHLIKNSSITPFQSALRKTKLDEITTIIKCVVRTNELSWTKTLFAKPK